MDAAQVGDLTRKHAVEDPTVRQYEYRDRHLAVNPQWLAGISDADLGELVLGQAASRIELLND
jgi:hypothetical protein